MKIDIVRRKRRSSSRSGQALVELAAGLIVVIPLLLIVIDCAIICIGASLNDSVCRDAARAAASGPPSNLNPGAPTQRAVTVIKHIYYSSMPMKVREAIVIAENVRDVPPQFMGGGVDGDVTLQTTIDIYPPFLVRAIGAKQVVLKSKHTVPITYVRPASDS